MKSPKIIFDTIIVSDIHLGSPISQSDRVLKLLKELKFRRLILLGDVFSDLDFSRLTEEHWELLSYLRKLSDPKKHIEIVWVFGNHDEGLHKVLGHLVGIKVVDSYVWMADNKKCIALHGHQFDSAIKHFPQIATLISKLFLYLQKIPGFEKVWMRWLDDITVRFQNLSKVLEDKALRYAEIYGYDVICCGHTHEAMHSVRNGVEYYNSGCWVKVPGTYIACYKDHIEVLQEKI